MLGILVSLFLAPPLWLLSGFRPLRLCDFSRESVKERSKSKGRKEVSQNNKRLLGLGARILGEIPVPPNPLVRPFLELRMFTCDTVNSPECIVPAHYI